MTNLPCYGTMWDSKAVECSGGHDAAYVSPSGSNVRPKCDLFDSCKNRTAMRAASAPKPQVIPATNLYNRPTPSPPTPVSQPHPSPPPQAPPVWSSQRVQPQPPPAVQPQVVGRVSTPQPQPQQAPYFQQFQQAPPQMYYASAQHTYMPPPLPPPQMHPQPYPQMHPQMMQPDMSAMYAYMQQQMQMMQMMQQMQYMAQGGGGPFPAPIYPGNVPVPMGMNPIQFMPMHQAMPGYLSVPENRQNPWKGLLAEVLRGMGKAFGHTLSHYMDNVTFLR